MTIIVAKYFLFVFLYVNTHSQIQSLFSPWMWQPFPNSRYTHWLVSCFSSIGDITITEFAAWSTSEISQNALMYYSGRLFWINGFRVITAQEIGQRNSVSVLESAKFNQFTIIQTSLKPLPGTVFYSCLPCSSILSVN